MKRLLVCALLLTLAAPGAALAAPKGDPGPPAHGCDQAAENDGDPYDSTCDGSPSENGNGDGNATGKPCAGCVGAADNKNPKGQMPDGSDHNNGYECDGNQGIGKTNPAHTGCEPYSNKAPAGELVKLDRPGTGFVDPDPASGPTGGMVLAVALVALLAAGGAPRLLRRLSRKN